MIRWFHRAAALAWAYAWGTLEKRSEWRTVWARGVFCEKPACGRVGQYWVEVNDRHWHCCRAHADELTDLLLASFGGVIDDLNRRERAGEFLPKGQIVRGGGYMGPRGRHGQRLMT